MEQSESINELAAALAIAQGQITGALKDSANPFYKSKYADLASVWDACREHLSKNGLCVIQTTSTGRLAPDGVGTMWGPFLVTTLAHKSGQWMRGYLPIKAKDDGPQAQGSGITYARRYALAAIVGVAQVDDDGNEASKGHTKASPRDDIDLSGVDQELATQYAGGLRNALALSDTAKVLELHDELSTQTELYIVVGDKLKAKERADLRSIVQGRVK